MISFFCFDRLPTGQRAAMGTPEAAQKSLQTWLVWIRELEAKGHLKNPGQPLEPTGKVVRKDKMITHGPVRRGEGSRARFHDREARATSTRHRSWPTAARWCLAAATWRSGPFA